MAVLYIDEGLTWLLQKRNGDASGKSLEHVRLYTAISPAISKASVKANFTEMTGMGYIFKSIASLDWAYDALDTVGHKQRAIIVKSWTFTAGAGATILGWYVTDTGNTKVMLAEAFSVAVVIPAGGGTLALTINDDYQGCT